MTKSGSTNLAGRLSAVLVFATLVSGCAPTPSERIMLAWEAAEAENLEGFVAHFTQHSAPLIRDLQRVKTRTRGGRTYIKSVFDLLPSGELGEIEVHPRFATLIVRAAPPYTVQFLKEDGQWRIDATALDMLYQPMRPRE